MENEENNKAKEPQPDYGDKKITFFKSFEDLENDNYAWLATLKPEEHLHHSTELIKRVFAAELKKNPFIGNVIYFK